MSLSIQAPISENTLTSRLIGWLAAHITQRKARHTEAMAVEKLRKLEPHLQQDLNLDHAALWQPRPEIRQLHTPYLVATFSRDDDRRLWV